MSFNKLFAHDKIDKNVKIFIVFKNYYLLQRYPKKIINDVNFMGLFMITVWYPPNKAAEMAKLYLKQPREIPFVSKWRIFNTSGGIHGLKQYHLIYTERGKSEEAMGELNKYFMPFLNIEGFKYDVELLMGVSDSYKLLGMKWE